MDRYSQHLTYSLLATVGGLPLGCLVAGLLLGVYGLAFEAGDIGQFPNAFGFGFSVGFFALIIGILPSFAYGAPLYALLSQQNSANVLTVPVMGALPGLIALPINPSLAAFLLLFGICVSVSTHLLAKRRLARLRASGR